MTCFWSGILSSIEHFDSIGLKKRPGVIQFVKVLKEQNVRCSDVKWNGQDLRKQEVDEVFESIACYDMNTINTGYMCSICDPFLILICQLFTVNIDHWYLKNKMEYRNTKGGKRLLTFGSNRSHFYKK